jgi:hypothetical protein
MRRIVMPNTFVYVTPDNVVAAWIQVKYLDDYGNWQPFTNTDEFLKLTGLHHRM